MTEEYQFLVQQKNISQYAGQWIAVVGKTIFSGKSLQEALNKAETKFPNKQNGKRKNIKSICILILASIFSP